MSAIGREGFRKGTLHLRMGIVLTTALAESCGTCKSAAPLPPPPVPDPFDGITIGPASGELSRRAGRGEPVFVKSETGPNGATTYNVVPCAVRRSDVFKYDKLERIPRVLFESSLTEAASGSLSVPAGMVNVFAGVAARSSAFVAYERTAVRAMTKLPSRADLDGSIPSCGQATHVAVTIFTGAVAITRERVLSGSGGIDLFEKASLRAKGERNDRTSILLGKTGCPKPEEDVDCQNPISWTLERIPPDLGRNCEESGLDGKCRVCRASASGELRSHEAETIWTFSCENFHDDKVVSVELTAAMTISPRYPDHAGHQNWGALEVTLDQGGPAGRGEFADHVPLSFGLKTSTTPKAGRVSGAVRTPRCTKGDPGSECRVTGLTLTASY